MSNTSWECTKCKQIYRQEAMPGSCHFCGGTLFIKRENRGNVSSGGGGFSHFIGTIIGTIIGLTLGFAYRAIKSVFISIKNKDKKQ